MVRNMKKHLLMVIFSTFILFFTAEIFGCAEKVSLYATWSDSNGNTIMMNAQKRYTANLYDSTTNAFVESKGSFVYYLNTITFTDSNKESSYAEWDIQGNTLYLIFTEDDGDKSTLALYRTGEAVNVGEE